MTNRERDHLSNQIVWIPPYILGETSDPGPWINRGSGHY